MRSAHHGEVAWSGHWRAGIVGKCGGLRGWCATVLVVTEFHPSWKILAGERSHARVGCSLETRHAGVGVVVAESVWKHTILTLRIVSEGRSAQTMVGFWASV